MPKLVNPKLIAVPHARPCDTCHRATTLRLEEVGATTGSLRQTPICIFCVRAKREQGQVIR